MPVYFPVACRLSEYHDFAIENIEHAQRSRVSLLGRVTIAVSALVAYGLKTFKVRRAEMAIDASGIRRRSARGERTFSWNDVRAVRRFTPGYLIELDRGALLVPHRCIPGGTEAAAILAQRAAAGAP